MQKLGDRFDLELLLKTSRTCVDIGRAEVIRPLIASRPELLKALEDAAKEDAARKAAVENKTGTIGSFLPPPNHGGRCGALPDRGQ